MQSEAALLRPTLLGPPCPVVGDLLTMLAMAPRLHSRVTVRSSRARMPLRPTPAFLQHCIRGEGRGPTRRSAVRCPRSCPSPLTHAPSCHTQLGVMRAHLASKTITTTNNLMEAQAEANVRILQLFVYRARATRNILTRVRHCSRRIPVISPLCPTRDRCLPTGSGNLDSRMEIRDLPMGRQLPSIHRIQGRRDTTPRGRMVPTDCTTRAPTSLEPKLSCWRAYA